MDTTAITAFSGVVGSLVGNTASIATTWLTQHGTDRRKRLATTVTRHESLYSGFISECDACTRTEVRIV